MDKRHTVKKSLEFSNIIHNCAFVKNQSFVIYYNKDNGVGNYRFGISVSKKLGNAVHRNKFKRQLRFIIDKNKKYYQNDFDYIIIIRNGYVSLDFESNNKNFLNLMEIINEKCKEK
jgi:ribonuclease P protein component